ncbi:flagellar hook-length control protein FliK [Gracilibacillus xinjiangensis]|uniref:Flagellar hook-length control protein FliK n=1 Tax=Gracilibacillus xinjiangensis TaxID=1193282 RepID=A0ABV8WXH1_9BACI
MFVGANILPNMTATQTLPKTSNQSTSGNGFQQILAGVTDNQSVGTVRSLVLNQNDSGSVTDLLSMLSNASDETIKLLKLLLSGEKTAGETLQQLSDSDVGDAELLNLVQQLLNVRNHSEDQNLLPEFNGLTEEELKQLQDLISGITDENEKVNSLWNDFFAANLHLNATSSGTEVKVDQQQLSALWQKVETLINKFDNQTLTSKDYKQFMNLMQQWSQLSQQDSGALSSFLAGVDQSKSKDIWTKLVENYQNRMAAEKLYGKTQQVTKQDIAKWIQSALENYDTTMKSENSQSRTDLLNLTNQSATTKVQQFVIHVQQTNTEDKVAQKQLLDQFQQVIQKSSFLKTPNGTKQLMLRLQPEHLGDVMVKLTQVNGEMIVKMIVQSQAAKDLLEGNLNQLRHMFSPQQVVIEKQDQILTQAAQDKIWKDDSNPSSEQDQSANEEQHEQQTESEQDSNSSTFHDLLMDMKV